MFGFGKAAELKRALADVDDLSAKLYASERENEYLLGQLRKEEERTHRLAGKLLIATNELTPLKIAREKANANLAAANARRKAVAEEREAA